MIGTATLALHAAQRMAREAGLAVVRLGDDLEGEARELALEHSRMARRAARETQTPRPAVFLSGGETSVRVEGQGRGGPNLEYLLALAIGLEGHPEIWALAADTDGLDGNSGVAGGLIGPETLQTARTGGTGANLLLNENDSATFFAEIGGLIESGPTRTNVSDFRAILLL